jgi:hypothetical protein
MTGRLHLNGEYVGDVDIRGWHGPWGIGEFAARPAFGQFAPLFAEWSRLMRAGGPTLSPQTAERLRQIEFQTYALRAALWIVSLREWRTIDILNIDGTMIEWKEGWRTSDAPPPPPAAPPPAPAATVVGSRRGCRDDAANESCDDDARGGGR